MYKFVSGYNYDMFITKVSEPKTSFFLCLNSQPDTKYTYSPSEMDVQFSEKLLPLFEFTMDTKCYTFRQRLRSGNVNVPIPTL